MGRRRKEAAQMGKALIKDRFKGKKTRSGGSDSFLHTTELNDGYDGRILNLQSVTEQSSMEDFLLTAEMAGRDFTAEKSNVQLVTPQHNSVILSKEQQQKVQAKQDFYKNLLRIPRRPPWNESTPADKLRHDEHMTFLEWRRQLGRLQEEEHIVITPYEKNLDFWRQLWRVIERSDVIVQIVDARNPLLFWCADLDSYVKEVDPRKQTVLLINKADLLTVKQRETWAEYFAAQKVKVVFWSAVEETARIEREKAAMKEESMAYLAEGLQMKADLESGDDSDDDSDDADEAVTPDVSEEKAEVSNSGCAPDGEENQKMVAGEESRTNINTQQVNEPSKDTKDSEIVEADDSSKEDEELQEEDSDGYETFEEETDDEAEEGMLDDAVVKKVACGRQDSQISETCGVDGMPREEDRQKSSVAQSQTQAASSNLQNSEELLALFRSMAQTQYQQGVTTVGMVGYPNVGKSSTINAILRTKKVPVSATPGRTKHFQTLFVEKDLMLCDCPGLVFPSFVNSKADLVINGILPIDQLQDSEPPTELVCHRVGRRALERLYGITLPPPEEWEDADKPPRAYDVLHAYGLVRGFMSHKGNPDRPRAARYILKDYVNGKLLFCHPPPGSGIEPAAFQKPPFTEPGVFQRATKVVEKTAGEVRSEALNEDFFNQLSSKVHAKGPHAVKDYIRTEASRQVGVQDHWSASEASTPSGSQTSLAGKPWKKHNNRNKKEKLRRVYANLDTQ